MVLENKKIIVTGAGQGIGRAIALACSKEGAVVGLNYLTSEESAKTLHKEYPQSFRLMPFDVSDPEAAGAAITRFLENEKRIDGLVNNAGINLGGLLASQGMEAIKRQIETNLLGPIICARAVLPAMMQQRGGVIINVGSVSAMRPSRGQSVYAATKGALESFTRALAVEYGRKAIRVHCLRPGPTETRMFETTKALAGEEILARLPLRRFGRPEEVAEMAVYLLSDKAQFVTGSVHTIDGGYLAG
ncbi:MAG: SDR family oxidoreductase [Elusimicrobia bacterium]|nr:SDR family oxidoreductase [Elusimicrobiota bacterium]